MAIYKCDTLDIHAFKIVKFDDDFNVVRVYRLFKVSQFRWECSCSGWHGHGYCKHPKLIQHFYDNKHINDGYFWDVDLEEWLLPLNHPSRILARKMAAKRGQKC